MEHRDLLAPFTDLVVQGLKGSLSLGVVVEMYFLPGLVVLAHEDDGRLGEVSLAWNRVERYLQGRDGVIERLVGGEA